MIKCISILPEARLTLLSKLMILQADSPLKRSLFGYIAPSKQHNHLNYLIVYQFPFPNFSSSYESFPKRISNSYFSFCIYLDRSKAEFMTSKVLNTSFGQSPSWLFCKQSRYYIFERCYSHNTQAFLIRRFLAHRILDYYLLFRLSMVITSFLMFFSWLQLVPLLIMKIFTLFF